MPQVPTKNDRMSLRIASNDKALLIRAAALQQTNLTEFVVKNAVKIAQDIVSKHERLALSERDSLQVLSLLDQPPEPNAKLISAAFALPKK